MAIDVHVHAGSFPSVEAAGDELRTRADVASFRTRHPDTYRRFATEEPIDNGDRLLEVMDEHDVEYTLIQPRPGISNEFVAGMAAKRPRLIPLALPTPWPVPRTGDPLQLTTDQILQELRLCVDELGMRAVGELYVRRITGEIHPERIADAFSPLMEVIARDRLPVQIPTAWTQFPGGLYYGDPLWVDELCARYPDVPVVLTKMGRGLTRYFESSLVVALRNRNVYFDTSDTTPEHLTRAIASIGPDRIMFGTDWSATWQFLQDPSGVHDIARNTIFAATGDPGARDQILTHTAAQVYADAIAAAKRAEAPTASS